MNKFTGIGAAAVLALTIGAAQADPMGPLDVDGDAMLTPEEFAPIAEMGASFAAYDSDGDGMLSETEYNEGVQQLAADLANSPDDENSARALQRTDELTRIFDNEVGDRDAFLQLFQN